MSFSPCTHRWNLPLGSPCPDCLWQQALTGLPNQVRMALMRKMIACAIASLPNPSHRWLVRYQADSNNNYHALKLARELNYGQASPLPTKEVSL